MVDWSAIGMVAANSAVNMAGNGAFGDTGTVVASYVRPFVQPAPTPGAANTVRPPVAAPAPTAFSTPGVPWYKNGRLMAVAGSGVAVVLVLVAWLLRRKR